MRIRPSAVPLKLSRMVAELCEHVSARLSDGHVIVRLVPRSRLVSKITQSFVFSRTPRFPLVPPTYPPLRTSTHTHTHTHTHKNATGAALEPRQGSTRVASKKRQSKAIAPPAQRQTGVKAAPKLRQSGARAAMERPQSSFRAAPTQRWGGTGTAPE